MSKPKTQKELTEVLLKAEKFFRPSAKVLKEAVLAASEYEKLYQWSIKNPEKFWEKAAKELAWFKAWKKVLDKSKKPFYRWFVGAKCNIFYNAVERHQDNPAIKNKMAILWENEGGKKRTLTYAKLYKTVNQFAAGLKKLGIKKGDRVSVYLPNIPEIAITMLSCAKIGAVHSVVYAGFSAVALRNRINDAGAKILVTADGSVRRGKIIPLKAIADEALTADCQSVKKVIVVKNQGNAIPMKKGRDFWFEQLMKQKLPAVETVRLAATDPLFILYTSGTTARPKGVVHCHGGYMVGVYRTLTWVFDLKSPVTNATEVARKSDDAPMAIGAKNGDIFWSTADPGWITGHSYIIYGPLMAGVTTVMYEGAPDFPQPDRIWQVVAKNKVTIFYTAPTLIRLLMRYGNKWPKKHNLKSLRLLGSVGEPINPEAWHWYYRYIGGKRCPIMDTWWQTETGMFMITPLPILPLKAGSATRPFFGIQAAVVDRAGRPVPAGKGGFLVIKNPWPAMLQTLFHNPRRYEKTYFEKIPGYYTTGDLAHLDKDGYFWIQGRADDVLSISGHRIGTAEVESALVSHGAVVEAGVIGKPHPIKGEVAKAFVILRPGYQFSEALAESIKKHVRETMGPMVVIEEIEPISKLPKTRSGKIMRRVLKAKELGLPLGDISTLED